MTREEIERELQEARNLREHALMNLYRCDGAIAAFELLLQKMDEKDAAILKRIQEDTGDSPKENEDNGKV